MHLPVRKMLRRSARGDHVEPPTVREQALLERLSTCESRYQQLTSTLPRTAVAFFDPELRLQSVAGEAVSANGVDPAAMAGRALDEVVSAPLMAVLAPHYRAAATEGTPSEVDFVSPLNGRDFRMIVRPVLDAGGAVVGGMSLVTDVTEDRSRQQQLEQIGAVTSLGSCRYDLRTGWHFDASLLSMWGMDRYDSYRLRHQLIHPGDRDTVNAAWDEALTVGGRVSLQYRVRHSITAELRYVQMHGSGEVDETGTLIRAVATHVDVTGAVSAREAEQRARARAAAERTVLLRRVSDTLGASQRSVPEMARFVADLAAAALGEGAVLRVLRPDQRLVEPDVTSHQDPAQADLLAEALARRRVATEPVDSSYGDVVDSGRLVSTVQPPAEVEQYRAAMSAQLGQDVQHFIFAPARHGGRVYATVTVYRTDSAVPYERGDEDLLQVLADRLASAMAASWANEAAERERSKRHAVADQLQELTKEQRELLEHLAETESRERSLLAEAVHDDPLQLIVAAILRVDLLQLRLGADADAELEAIADLLETSVEKLRQLIVALAPMDLAEGLLPAMGSLADGIFIGTGTQVRVLGVASVPLSAGATTAAYRVVREALVNARKHARATTVTIEVDQSSGWTHICVSDDGVGSATLDAGPGHLGLATMRARAAAEGGRVEIRSAPGQGTSVSAAFPLKAGESAEPVVE